MKTQIRRGVFETNSSSTHALALYSKSDWDRFVNGEMVMKNDGEFTGDLVERSSVAENDIYDRALFENEEDYNDADYYDYKYISYDSWEHCDELTEGWTEIKKNDTAVAVMFNEEG